MLVDRNAVEAELGGELELVQIAVVKFVTFDWIEIAVRQHDPGCAVLVGIAHVEIGIGHQMKHEDFHGASRIFPWSRPMIVRAAPSFTSGRMTASREGPAPESYSQIGAGHRAVARQRLRLAFADDAPERQEIR